MNNNHSLRRKYSFKVSGHTHVLLKKPFETEEHVLLKILTYALYIRKYPESRIEVSIGEHYKPDLIQLDHNGHPVFWAECGLIGKQKICNLLKKYKKTHFVMVKYHVDLKQFSAMIRKECKGIRRYAPIDCISIPENMHRFIDEDNNVHVRFRDCEIITIADNSMHR